MSKIISFTNYSKIDREDFLKGKLKLKAKNYPMEETFIFVKHFYAKCAKSILKNIPDNINLILTPSTFGENIIPFIFAKLIANDKNDVNIINGQDFCSPLHSFEAKNRLGLDRYNELIDFKLSNIDKLKTLINNKPTYIVEDWAATGESIFNLRKRLLQNKIFTNNVISLINSGIYLTKQKEIDSFFKILKTHTTLEKQNDLKESIQILFYGYLQNKLFKFIRFAHANPTKLSSIADDIILYANNYRQSNLIYPSTQKYIMENNTIAIIGSRSFDDYKKFDDILSKMNISKIISGGAKGPDTFAEEFAKKHNIPIDIIKPDYNKYPGKVAPIIRNKEIIKRADMVIAFWNGKSKGTLNAIEHANKLNKHVQIINFTNKLSALEILAQKEINFSNKPKHKL